MEETNSQEQQRSNFLLGLTIGSAVGGIFVLLMDKEERKTVFKNLKTDWKTILEKVGEVFEGKESQSKIKNKKDFKDQDFPPGGNDLKNPGKLRKKFFIKSGRKLA